MVKKRAELFRQVGQGRLALRRRAFAVAKEVIGQDAEVLGQIGDHPLPDLPVQAKAMDENDDWCCFGAGQGIGSTMGIMQGHLAPLGL